ncbi:hypothetical protein RRG08_019377 [Elysia crispata]|uniref:Uncharacterized protein n=1 Tax=Elysia crispata TaxID=231223 RepID=A0AAE0XTE2_9GAST|nr:hypothetical protein RRG08_019377 [Elysia crispata]
MYLRPTTFLQAKRRGETDKVLWLLFGGEGGREENDFEVGTEFAKTEEETESRNRVTSGSHREVMALHSNVQVLILAGQD